MKYNVTYIYDHAVITITVNEPNNNKDLAEASAEEMLGNWGELNDVTVEELEEI